MTHLDNLWHPTYVEKNAYYIQPLWKHLLHRKETSFVYKYWFFGVGICDFSTDIYVFNKSEQRKYDWAHGKYNLAASVMEDLEVLK